jgi:hypothetical protein
MNRPRPKRIPKRDLMAIIELAHREGIGARRLSQLIGYAGVDHLRRQYRALGLAPLPANTYRAPSVRLIGLIECVTFLLIAEPKLNRHSGRGTMRPKQTEPA